MWFPSVPPSSQRPDKTLKYITTCIAHYVILGHTVYAVDKASLTALNNGYFIITTLIIQPYGEDGCIIRRIIMPCFRTDVRAPNNSILDTSQYIRQSPILRFFQSCDLHTKLYASMLRGPTMVAIHMWRRQLLRLFLKEPATLYEPPHIAKRSIHTLK
jgi:hypothetical protein